MTKPTTKEDDDSNRLIELIKEEQMKVQMNMADCIAWAEECMRKYNERKNEISISEYKEDTGPILADDSDYEEDARKIRMLMRDEEKSFQVQ